MVIVLLLACATWVLHRPRSHECREPRALARGSRVAPGVDLALVCDLLCVALAAGASLPRACAAVGEAAGSGHGQVLARAAYALRLGASWAEAWAGHTLGEVLAPAWQDGADPTPLLRQLARSLRANRAASAKEAAARLSVHLVLPVGLCLLPAFILVGIVPLLVSGSIGMLG